MTLTPSSSSGRAGASNLLAAYTYNPNPGGAETIYTTTSTSLVDVDAANMAISFTAPASGVVICSVCTHWIPSQNGATKGGIVHGGMREGSTTVAGPNIVCRDVTGNAFTDPITLTLRWLVSGLVPGSAHTWKLAYCADLTTGATVGVAVGGTGLGTNAGPATFEVWDGQPA